MATIAVQSPWPGCSNPMCAPLPPSSAGCWQGLSNAARARDDSYFQRRPDVVSVFGLKVSDEMW
eukprot:9485090-Pyramimonas_sp.AAC.2